tara:strand:+ start:3222 stop:3929 length:708 start_codon:yes stop_codon:yes gene_type:complete
VCYVQDIALYVRQQLETSNLDGTTMAFVRKDHFHKKAKQAGLRSRAAYKLEELNKRFHLFKQNGKVLDLGAAPGGWMQVAAKAVGRHGRVVGIDRLEMDPLPFSQATILLGDLLDPIVQEQALKEMNGPADCVLSDMAPNITGIRLTDCARSHELAMIALNVARRCLRTGGAFVVKIFPGDDLEDFRKEMKHSFRKVRTTRPEATRKTSSEIYIIGTQFRGTEEHTPSKETTSGH